jgi:hypothetical protein
VPELHGGTPQIRAAGDDHVPTAQTPIEKGGDVVFAEHRVRDLEIAQALLAAPTFLTADAGAQGGRSPR